VLDHAIVPDEHDFIPQRFEGERGFGRIRGGEHSCSSPSAPASAPSDPAAEVIASRKARATGVPARLARSPLVARRAEAVELARYSAQSGRLTEGFVP
jgi:hypothetical protein